jgi:hypothetical protein
MRALLAAACVGFFFLWDLSVNHAGLTKGIADAGRYCLATIWQLIS